MNSYQRKLQQKRDENVVIKNGKRQIQELAKQQSKKQDNFASHGRGNKAGTGINSQQKARQAHLLGKRSFKSIDKKFEEEQCKLLESAGNDSTLQFLKFLINNDDVSNNTYEELKKKKKLSKKDKIILDNMERKILDSVKEDEDRINRIEDITHYSEILKYFKKIRNDNMKLKYLYVSLKKYLDIYNSNKTSENKIIILEIILHIEYFNDILEKNKITQEDIDIFEKAIELTNDMNREKLLFQQKIEPIPNNSFKLSEFKLEGFQTEFVKSLYNNDNIIASCSTGSGKTIISLSYLATLSSGVFIVPNEAVGIQLTSLLMRGNWVPNGIALVTKGFVYETTTNPSKIIGTPIEVQKYLFNINSYEFDVIIFDEIHLLNVNETLEDINYSNSVKFLMKLTIGQKLFLSATLTDESIENIVNTQEECKIIKYNKRFTVLQNQVIDDNGIQNINALGYLDTDEDWLKLNIELTPIDIWKFFDDYLEDISKFMTKKFKKKLFSLDDITNLIPIIIKQVKNELSSEDDDDIENIKDILSEFKCSLSNDKEIDIYEEIMLLKSLDQLPLCNFRDNPMENGIKLLDRLHEEQDKTHPNWLLEKKRNFKNIAKNQKTIEKLQDTSSEKKNISKTASSKQERDSMYKKLEGSKEVKNERISALQEENLGIDTNIYAPHPDYFMGKIQISDDRMRQIKRFLSKLYNKNIDYSNPMLMSIQHGIAIYDISMPIFYLNIILDLIKEHHIGILFADTSIGAGLDMPFRTVIPNEFASTQSRIQQQGRAGRRGLDTKGYSIINGDKIIENMNAKFPSVDLLIDYQCLKFTFIMEPFIHFNTKKKSENYLALLKSILSKEKYSVIKNSNEQIYTDVIQSICSEDELTEYLTKSLFYIEKYQLNEPILAKFVTSIDDFKQNQNLSSIILLYILKNFQKNITNPKGITNIELRRFLIIMLSLFDNGDTIFEDEISSAIFKEFNFECKFDKYFYDLFSTNRVPENYKEKYLYKKRVSNIKDVCIIIKRTYEKDIIDKDILSLINSFLKDVNRILEKCQIL